MLLISSATAEAGITLSKETTKLTGDPTLTYSFTAILNSGTLYSSTKTGQIASSFELYNLIGIDITSFSVHVTISPSTDQNDWSESFTPVPVVFNKQKYKGSDVTFTYIGKTPLPAGKTGAPLGEFTITELIPPKAFQKSPPPLPPWIGSIPASYTWSVGPKGAITTGGGPIQFTVLSVPEPSSLVVVALVGCSLTGVGLLRRRRRVA